MWYRVVWFLGKLKFFRWFWWRRTHLWMWHYNVFVVEAPVGLHWRYAGVERILNEKCRWLPLVTVLRIEDENKDA